MRDFFANLNDNPIMKMLSKSVDLVVLNVIFVLTCIPLVTIGAALTALNYVCVTDWDTQNAHIISMYFRSFKQNFKQSTVLWFIMLAFGGILGGLGYTTFMQWKELHTTSLNVFMVVSVVLLIVYCCIFTFVWPLLAKFDNTVGNMIKNALVLAVSHLPGTVVSWAVVLIWGYGLYMSWVVRFVAILFMFSMIAYIQSSIFRSAFEPFMEADKAAAELEEEDKQSLEEEADEFLQEEQDADEALQAEKADESMQEEESGESLQEEKA